MQIPSQSAYFLCWIITTWIIVSNRDSIPLYVGNLGCVPNAFVGSLIARFNPSSCDNTCPDPTPDPTPPHDGNLTAIIHKLQKAINKLENNLQTQNVELHKAINKLESNLQTQTVELHGAIDKLESNLQAQVATLEDKLQGQAFELHGAIDKLESNLHTQAITLEKLQLKVDNIRAPGSNDPPKQPLVGSFHTGEVRRIDRSEGHTSKMIPFALPYPKRPDIPVALTLLDMGSSQNIRAACYSSNIEESYFEINVDTWSGTQLYEASCSWMELGENHPDFQSGTYDTLSDHPWNAPQMQNSRLVTFSRKYDTPPEVVVWLNAVDMRRDSMWRVRTYVTDITTTGFTIHIDTWGDSELYSGAASWVSYTPGTAGVRSGTLRAPSTTGYAKFGKDTFSLPPRVILGINSFDIGNAHNLRLVVGTTSVNASGMMWFLGSWGDTDMHSASASYLALD